MYLLWWIGGYTQLTELRPQQFFICVFFTLKQGLIKSLTYPAWAQTCDPPATPGFDRFSRRHGCPVYAITHQGLPAA